MLSSSTVPIVSTIAASVAVAIVAAIVHIIVVSIVTATIIIIATITAAIMLGDTLHAANPSRFWFTLVVAMVVSCVHNDNHQCG